MSWDNAETTTAETGGGQWNADEFAAPAANEFEAAGFSDANGGDDFGAGENGGGGKGSGGSGGGCFNCGEDGHMKSECPNPAVPREFVGTCRSCGNDGHRAADCPDKPPKVCNNCKEEGHVAFECKSPRKVEYPGVEDVAAEVAWDQMRIAAEERDLDDVLEAGQRYLKAIPDLTYQQLEGAFRSLNVGIYLVAIEKELTSTYTNMDLQGNLGKTYSVSWRFDPKPMRPTEKDKFAATPEENLKRLADAGSPVDRGVPKCSNCDELGHSFKACPQEKQENADKAVVKCYNCEEIGHRVRDCPNPRPDKFACRNCKQSGHSSKECPEPRSAEGVECKKCNQTGHFAKDCPQGGGGGGTCHNCGEEGHRKQDCANERKIICRNCDEEGHTGRECPKPRDYSRVRCQNCNELGHTKVRCKQPIVEEAGGSDGDYGGGYGGGTSGKATNDISGGNNDFAAPALADWETPAATQEVAADGWDDQGGSSW